MLTNDLQIQCPYCSIKQWIEIDPTEGETQSLIIDCEVCCRPIEIAALWDEERQSYRGQANRSSGLD